MSPTQPDDANARESLRAALSALLVRLSPTWTISEGQEYVFGESSIPFIQLADPGIRAVRLWMGAGWLQLEALGRDSAGELVLVEEELSPGRPTAVAAFVAQLALQPWRVEPERQEQFGLVTVMIDEAEVVLPAEMVDVRLDDVDPWANLVRASPTLSEAEPINPTRASRRTGFLLVVILLAVIVLLIGAVSVVWALLAPSVADLVESLSPFVTIVLGFIFFAAIAVLASVEIVGTVRQLRALHDDGGDVHALAALRGPDPAAVRRSLRRTLGVVIASLVLWVALAVGITTGGVIFGWG